MSTQERIHYKQQQAINDFIQSRRYLLNIREIERQANVPMSSLYNFIYGSRPSICIEYIKPITNVLRQVGYKPPYIRQRS